MKRIRTLLGLKGKLTLLEKVWLLGPLILWFSYRPVITLGQDSTSYYELSLAMVYCFVLALVGLPSLWRARKTLLQSTIARVVGCFVALSAVTLVFSPNVLRGFLTLCVIGALYLILLAGLVNRHHLKNLAEPLARLLVASAVGMSVVALVQVIAGIWLPGDSLLLCQGCYAQQFGFVRPNAFAIEPQFFGSLLLAPLLIGMHAMLSAKQYKGLYISTGMIALALFLTLSRGAIFAFAIGVLVLLVVYRKQLRKILLVLALLAVSFSAALVVQGSAAALNTAVDTTFRQAVSASINQLSLGLITLPVEDTALSAQPESAQPQFDGYVEESTNIRVSLSALALGTWLDAPFRVLFGVGLGGSGVAVHEHYPTSVGAREIVQNQYIEYLLEYGLVGLALFASMITGLFWTTRHARWVWALFVAYLTQWFFFSGYPNALHIYLVMIAAFVVLGRYSETQKPRTSL